MGKQTSLLSGILNRLMFEKKIRATELAREVNLPQPTVHRMATGKCTNPHKSSLEPIADYFDISVDQLKGDVPLPEHLLNENLPAQQPKVKQISVIDWKDA